MVKRKILCLHGMRTSAAILSMQTAAMQYHTPLQFEFIDAPYDAVGPPDRGVAMFYPDHSYYEWFIRGSGDCHIGLDESLEYLIKHLKETGPYDGILGFSQGVSMVTRLARLQQMGNSRFGGLRLFEFVISIGGVPPKDIEPCQDIDIPSLHIMGTADSLLPKSKEVLKFFHPENRVILEHDEGHNIPSMRTGLYPLISEWVNNLSKSN